MVTTATTKQPVKYHVTEDVKPVWFNVIRAMQAACHRNQGYATVAIKVLVNREGEPLNWSEPKLEKIHPRTPYKDVLLNLTSIE